MIRISLILLLSLFCFALNAQLPYSEKYSNGNIRAKGRILADSTRIGAWKFFYESGKLESEGEYKNGKESGTWTYYYLNGNIKRQEAKEDGEILAWYKYIPDSLNTRAL